MRYFEYEMKDSVGIDARPARLLVKEAKKYTSKIVIGKDGKTAEARKQMQLWDLV